MARREKKSPKERQEDPFRRVSWDDLEIWAGSKIVNRGQGYHRRGAVRDLALAADGALMAWVFGSDRYATRVVLDESGELSSECSCPYWDTCKHAIAVVLAYLDRLKSGEDAPPVADGDQRLEEIARQTRHLEDPEDGLAEDEWDDGDGDLDDENYLDEEDRDDEEEALVRCRPPVRAKGAPSSRRPGLQRLTKAELIALIEEVGYRYPEVWTLVDHRQAIAGGKTDKILQAVRAAIQDLREPVWDHEWGDSPSVDLDRLGEQLEALHEAGQADTLAQLGPELLEAAGRTLESEQEGESAYELCECLEVIIRAVAGSHMAEADRIEWTIDLVLEDEYGLCEAGLEEFREQPFSRKAWAAVAGRLEQRLERLPRPTRDSSFSDRYHRDQLADWAITAVTHAGLEERIIPLCEREAPITRSYERLVRHLMMAGRLEEAERWCKQGIAGTESSKRGVAANLRQAMQEIAGQRGDPLRVVALKADEYFHRPSLEAYLELTEAAQKNGVGDAVEEWARHFLVTGQTPPGISGRPLRKRKGDPGVPWPLPDPDLPPPSLAQESPAPMTDILIMLAIKENTPDEVLRWYDKRNSGKGVRWWDSSLDIEVADAVAGTHTDRAVAIYKREAESLIDTVTPRGYQAAGPFLRKIKRALNNSGKGELWASYLESLQQANRRRPRCMEVLGRVARGDRPIIDG